MTHYNTLGVSENANSEEIKKAYRKLANQYHPDKGGDTNRFQQIQAAYDTIGDNNRRAQYDAERRGGTGGFRFTVNGQDLNSGMPPEMEEMLRNFGFAFGQGFAGSGGDPFSHFRQPRKNKDLQIEIIVSLASTLEEQTKVINVKTTNGDVYPVEIKIPKGIRPESTIKYPNLGDNFFSTLPRGDLYIRVQIEANTEFGIDNLDLIKNIEIDCIRATVGDSVVINGLDEKQFELTIPAGTQPNTRFRIPNQGLYVMNQNTRGSLIINVKINIPVNLTAEQKQTLKELFFIQ
jgi:DnaJ-class molecular chaperone